MSDTSSRQSSLPFRSKKQTHTPSSRDYKSSRSISSDSKHPQSLYLRAITASGYPRGRRDIQESSSAGNQEEKRLEQVREQRLDFEVKKTYKKTVSDISRERFALINHPTKGVAKIKIQDSEGFKVPFPKTEYFQKAFSSRTKSTVKAILAQRQSTSKRGSLVSPLSSQYSGKQSFSPSTEKIIEQSKNKKSEQPKEKKDDVLKRFSPAFKYEHLLEGERTLGLPPHYKILHQQQSKLDLTLNGMLQQKSSQARWRPIGYLSDIITRNHLLEMNVHILRKILHVCPGFYDTTWLKNDKGVYELNISFPMKKKVRQLESPSKRITSSRVSGRKNIFIEAEKGEKLSPVKKKQFISSAELMDRKNEFKRGLLNECLVHYDRNISQIPVEKRPMFDPVKEKVWPRFFDVYNLPAIPPSGSIADKPNVKKIQSLTDFLKESQEKSDSLLQAAMENAVKKTEERKSEPSPDMVSISSQSSVFSNSSSRGLSYQSGSSSSSKRKGPLILTPRRKKELHEKSLLAQMRSRSPSPLIRDPTLTKAVPKEKTFIEIPNEKKYKVEGYQMQAGFIEKIKKKQEVLEQLSQSSKERQREAEVQRLEGMLNHEYSLHSRRSMQIQDVYKTIQKQWLDTRGERLRYEEFMSLVEEVKEYRIFKVDDIGTFLQRNK